MITHWLISEALLEEVKMTRRAMTRRATIRRAVLVAFGMVMGKFDALKATSVNAQGPAQSKAALTVDLDQWGALVFSHKGKTLTISSAEIFESLREGQ